MPRRRRTSRRFSRVRRIGGRVRRSARRARGSLGGMRGMEIAKGAIGLLAVGKIKDYLNIHFGGNNSALDRDVEMIITGLVAPHAKLGNAYLVPAGASALIADLADGFIFGGGHMGGGYAGSTQSNYAGG